MAMCISRIYSALKFIINIFICYFELELCVHECVVIKSVVPSEQCIFSFILVPHMRSTYQDWKSRGIVKILYKDAVVHLINIQSLL